MSWAMRRRILYATGVFLFFLIVVGGPVAYHWYSIAPTCLDGQQNQDETAPDMGGVCPWANVYSLTPSSVLWARGFKIRDGSYSAAAYIENPNDLAGFEQRTYKFSLYDSDNILIAERTGVAFVMPGGVTPIYEPDIDTGERIVTHTYFEFTSAPQWLQLSDNSNTTKVTNRNLTEEASTPRLEATVTNTDVTPRTNIQLVAVIFDTAGNAFAASASRIERLEAGQAQQVVFTWPNPFPVQVGRIDIIPVELPKPAWKASCRILLTGVQPGAIQCGANAPIMRTWTQ
jgi:hypothetical protein